MELSRDVLWESDEFLVLDSRWDPATHRHDRKLAIVSPCIVLMRRGTYSRTFGNDVSIGDANTATFYSPGTSPVISHPTRIPTRGTTIRIQEDLLAEMLADYDGARGPFPAHDRPVTSRTAMMHATLFAGLTSSFPGDEIVFEEVLMGLVREILDDLFAIDPVASLPVSDATKRRVTTAKEYVASRQEEKVTLQDVSRETQCSSWYLSRIFARAEGIPVYRYLNRLRLRTALDRLRGGDGDITRVALDSGFSSHSHFTTAFRDEFGMAPRDFRGANPAALARRIAPLNS